MPHIKEYNVNLDLPAAERWLFLKEYKSEIRELLDCYLHDFAEADFIFNSIGDYKLQVVSQEYLEEINCISEISGFTPNEVLIANLYYDLLKFYFGCTAFSVWSNNQMWHARNLDWHSMNNLLSKHTAIFNYQRNGQTVFKTIGWFGFIGALSGTKQGCFSLTLNAVLSGDAPQIAQPITFLLRDALSNCSSFSEAKNMLENTPIASDCLILLSGIAKEEMAVIERTPNRFASRQSGTDYLAVTNDYKLLNNDVQGGNVLQATSCGRYDKATMLIRQSLPLNSQECMNILKDEQVMMGITVQQMVFNNNSGELLILNTNHSPFY